MNSKWLRRFTVGIIGAAFVVLLVAVVVLVSVVIDSTRAARRQAETNTRLLEANEERDNARQAIVDGAVRDVIAGLRSAGDVPHHHHRPGDIEPGPARPLPRSTTTTTRRPPASPGPPRTPATTPTTQSPRPVDPSPTAPTCQGPKVLGLCPLG